MRSLHLLQPVGERVTALPVRRFRINRGYSSECGLSPPTEEIKDPEIDEGHSTDNAGDNAADNSSRRR
jgi:hypothetical protein